VLLGHYLGGAQRLAKDAGSMKLLITGISHKTAPVEVRERFAFPEPSLPQALQHLLSQEGIAEAVILSTCNRVEIAVTSDDVIDLQSAVDSFLAQFKPLESIECYLYRYRGREAIQHLFRVAASLDSMVIGEPQILGQLKAAYATAKSQGALNGLLEAALTRAFGVAKRVRSETGIGQMAVSISYAAVELARSIFGSLTGKTVMIVGAGKMSELAARHLRRCGASHIFITNRTHEKALDLATLFQGTPIEYTRFLSMLPEVDILITSSAAPHYVLQKNEIQHVINVRKNKPMFLIDIAVPRNIAPDVNEVDNIFLYDVDDLQAVVNANIRERLKHAGHAEEMIAHEVDRMMTRLKVQEIAPTIMGLQEQLEQIRAAEIERMRKKFGPLTPEQEEALQALTRGIVNKIAHGPISELRRQAGEPEGIHVIRAIRKVFRLED
jgi:glutamyl-tRNA reductase